MSMSDPRFSGLLLMGVSIAAFLGTTTEALPPMTFFPALLLFCIGAFKFIRTNNQAMAKAEKKVEGRLNPTLRKNGYAHARAERLAAKRGGALSSLNESDADAEQAARIASEYTDSGAGHAANAIEIGDNKYDLVVTTDVSFPVEVQSGDALADQLSKLNQLMAQGVLTEEEYAVAKTKLLS
jgi:hypothetical protein